MNEDTISLAHYSYLVIDHVKAQNRNKIVCSRAYLEQVIQTHWQVWPLVQQGRIQHGSYGCFSTHTLKNRISDLPSMYTVLPCPYNAVVCHQELKCPKRSKLKPWQDLINETLLLIILTLSLIMLRPRMQMAERTSCIPPVP